MGLEMPACSAISSIDTAWNPRLAKAAPATASIWRSRSSRGMRGRTVGPCWVPDAVVLKLTICYSGVTYSRVSDPTNERELNMTYAFVDQMMEQNKTGELRSPVSQTFDMHLVEYARGEAAYEMDAREELANPLGVIQGGVATALAHAAMAAATTTILTDEEIQKSAITTIDIFARFIRPVNAKKVDRLRAEARVVRAGGRLVWAEADVLADGEVVGKFASTGIRVSFDPKAYVAERATPDE